MWTSSPSSSLLVSWAISGVLLLVSLWLVLHTRLNLKDNPPSLTVNLPSRNALFTLIVLVFVSGALIGWYGTRPFHVETLHNVHILERYDRYNFRAEVENPTTHNWNEFTLTLCHDFSKTDDIITGSTLTLLMYEEHPGCMSVRRDDLGFIVSRDPTTHRPILTDFRKEQHSHD